jgi:hypothetical protein
VLQPFHFHHFFKEITSAKTTTHLIQTGFLIVLVIEKPHDRFIGVHLWPSVSICGEFIRVIS